MTSPSRTEDLLGAVPPESRDSLTPLSKTSAVVEELAGYRPHVSAVQRWARKGVAGVFLQTVTVGRPRFTTRRWLIEFFAAVDEARRSRGAAPRRAPAPSSATATRDEEAALARHGIGQEGDES